MYCTNNVLEGVQFLSDELSEVSKNLKLTVQFLRADFAAVSELSGKNLSCVLKIDILFVFMHTRWRRGFRGIWFLTVRKMKMTFLKVIILSPTAAIASAKLSSYSS